jgi:hypothetical protein
MRKSNYCTNLTFGGILNRHGHFKHTLRAQRCRAGDRWTQPCHTVPLSHRGTGISGKKKVAFLLDLYLYFPDIPRTWKVGVRIKYARLKIKEFLELQFVNEW